MANVSIRKSFYRLEQVAGVPPTFVLNNVFNGDILATDIKRIDAVNALGGADIGGFPYLYSKVTFRQASLLQEAYTLETVLQWQTELNS